MAPQLGMGTFRILTVPGGSQESYATSDGTTETWAMRIGHYTRPTGAGGPVTMMITPFVPVPPDFCAYVASQGGFVGLAAFDIVTHTNRPGCVTIAKEKKPRR